MPPLPKPTIVIPAHNEGKVIGRLLDALLSAAGPDEFDVLVVSNGSTDDTVQVCSTRGDVRVIEIETASKYAALQEADRVLSGFPRLYVDADVVIDTASVRELVRALEASPTLAVGPTRHIDLQGSSWPVRAYYDIWSMLPAVQDGLFGRGVLGVSEAGFARIAQRPDVMGDDLFFDNQFTAPERRILASATVVVRGPRTVPDLVRRRTRTAHGNRELNPGTASGSATQRVSGRAVMQLALRRPALWPKVVTFVALTVFCRARSRKMARSNTAKVWLRDESSRA